MNRFISNKMVMWSLIILGGIWSVACQEGDEEEWQDPLVLGMDLDERQGNFRTYLTDAPGDFEEVWVNIAGVEVSRQDGAGEQWHKLVAEQKKLNLLALQNDVTAVLGDVELAPGEYNQLRLWVADGAVKVGGEMHQLQMADDGVQIVIELGLIVEEGKQYVFVMDFDASESIKVDESGYMLQPSVAVDFVGNVEASGDVSEIYSRVRIQNQLKGEASGEEIADSGKKMQSESNVGEEPTAVQEGEIVQNYSGETKMVTSGSTGDVDPARVGDADAPKEAPDDTGSESGVGGDSESASGATAPSSGGDAKGTPATK